PWPSIPEGTGPTCWACISALTRAPGRRGKRGRPTAGGRPDQSVHVSHPRRERAETGRGPAHLARRLLGARSRDQSLHLVGRKLPHLWTAASGTPPELRRGPGVTPSRRPSDAGGRGGGGPSGRAAVRSGIPRGPAERRGAVRPQCGRCGERRVGPTPPRVGH